MATSIKLGETGALLGVHSGQFPMTAWLQGPTSWAALAAQSRGSCLLYLWPSCWQCAHMLHATGCCKHGASALQTSGLKFAWFVTWHG